MVPVIMVRSVKKSDNRSSVTVIIASIKVTVMLIMAEIEYSTRPRPIARHMVNTVSKSDATGVKSVTFRQQNTVEMLITNAIAKNKQPAYNETSSNFFSPRLASSRVIPQVSKSYRIMIL